MLTDLDMASDKRAVERRGFVGNFIEQLVGVRCVAGH